MVPTGNKVKRLSSVNHTTKTIHQFFINSRKNDYTFAVINLLEKNISQLLEMSRRNLDLYYADYENLIMIGDFDTEPHRFDMKDFCESYKLSNLNEEPTCYKNPEHPSCIDLILTKCPRSFQTRV